MCWGERERLKDLYVQGLRLLVRQLTQQRDLRQATLYAEKAAAADPLQEELHRDLMQLYAATGQPSLALRQYREMEARWQQELGELPSAATRRLAQELAARMQQMPETAKSAPAATPKPPIAAAHPAVVTSSLLGPSIAASLQGMQTFLAATCLIANGITDLPEAAVSLLKKQCLAHGGTEVAGSAQPTLLAFARAADARACALALQRERGASEPDEATSLCLALHTGEADSKEARRDMRRFLKTLLQAGHGGQILCSEETALFLRRTLEPGAALRDLGRWKLEADDTAVPLFEVATGRTFPPLRAASAHTPVLPMQFTRFFGRETELTQIRSLLPAARLVTLTGPGGTGKTRLAIEAAQQLTDTWQGAVWFVSLAAVQEAGRIVEACLEALNLPGYADLEPAAQLREHLGRQPSLLILDNLEQVAEDAGEILLPLLRQIPTLTLLATSRQRLNIAPERELTILPLPAPNGETRLDRLASCESVRLFLDRAQAVKTDFQVTTHNAATIAAICDRLDGLPLALELAAARVQSLTPAQMLTQLEDRFAFLTTRRRDIPERHRMLRTTVDWSYRLLDPDLQRFFRRLSVFREGWTLEAARDVCEEEQALDALCQLQECSLIMVESREEGELRFRMLQTLRVFGEEQMPPEERSGLQERHARFFARLAEEADTDPAQEAAWFQRLEQEHENLRVALGFRLETDRIEEAARLCAALSGFWERHGWLREGTTFLERCLADPSRLEDPTLIRSLLGSAGWFAYLQGRYEDAQAWQQRNLKHCTRTQDEEGECIARNNLALIAQVQGRLEDARHDFEASLAIARRQGSQERQAARLSNLGLLAIQQKRYKEARTSLEAALAIYQSGHNAYGIAACLCNIAKLAIYEEKYGEAIALVGESLRLFQDAGDRSGTAYALANLGMAETLHHSSDEAATHLHAALTLCREMGLYSLVPGLLETWAGNDVARARFSMAAFALAAAERLRSELRMPRSAFEAQIATKVREALDAVPQQAELVLGRIRSASLTPEQILACILTTLSGELR